LVAVAEERGVHFLPDRRVDELLIEDGRVCGIQARGVNYYGHAVVLATGGFGANKELLAQYFPEALSAGDWQYYIGTEDAQGDALGLGEQVGAQIVEGGGLRMLYANLVKVHPRYDVQIPGWLLMVDSQGRRFVDEMIHYSVMDGTVRAIGDRLWAILDEAAVEAAAPDKPAEVKDPNGKPSPVWNSRVLHAAAAEGKIERADTVADLARQVGLPPEQLEGTIERYNESAALGFDRDYSKSAEFVRALRKPPFYAVEIRPAGVCITFTGLRIDIDAAVLDQASRPIPGLYAAGECTGGVVRDVYSGSGCSYANCLVYGRIAGREAAHTAGSDTLATEAVR
jgi:succinate dehydrogenase/fumarate reductase flavoprotein subunit